MSSTTSLKSVVSSALTQSPVHPHQSSHSHSSAEERIALIFTFLSCVITTYTIYRHLSNFTMPDQQKYVCRLLLMVPIYAVLSFLSLALPSMGVFFGFLRDSYEALVIYSFFQLLMGYLGGEDAVGEWLELRGHVSHTWLIQELCPRKRNLPLGHAFLKSMRQGILQFVVIKPLTSIIALICSTQGLYTEGNFRPTDSYIYLSLVNNVSVSVSLYCLVLFYLAAGSILKPFSPLVKFLVVKVVVFASYWQYCTLQVLNFLGIIASSDEVLRLQNSLVCVEMIFAAIVHHFAFPYSDYVVDETGRSPMMRLLIQNETGATIRHRNTEDYDDEEEDVDTSSKLLPKLIKVLDGRDVLKQGKEVFLDQKQADAELDDKPVV